MSKIVKNSSIGINNKQLSAMHGKPYLISEIKRILDAGGQLQQEYLISALITDSRRPGNAAEGLFFALNGRRDGHDFIMEAYRCGVRNFIVSKQREPELQGANFLLVDNVTYALQTLAAWHRGHYSLPVIGITGSNGKTIVKEWLYQLMVPDKNIVRNSKSYNSQIGVPLSVWQIDKQNNLGIFEAGISTAGEMERLESVIKPDVGILTHIGPAHDEGFNNRHQKISEKLGLFKNARVIIGNYEVLGNYKSELAGKTVFTWSTASNSASLYVYQKETVSGNMQLSAYFDGSEIKSNVPFSDEASVENSITCWLALLAMGYSNEIIKQRMVSLSPVKMRLELKNGINDCSVIDDSYNSDIQSLEIALNFLGQQNQHLKKTLILSDIYQSGLADDDLYKQVAALVKAKNVNKLIAVGETISKHHTFFDVNEKHFYSTTANVINDLRELGFSNETILIKGSRLFEFERISQALVQKAHETVLEINLNGLISNLNFYRSKLKPGVKIMAMVKAFSYGSGTFEVANVLQYHKADYLAVAYIDEGVALRTAGIMLPIMVLNPEPSAFNKLKEFSLEPVIYSKSVLLDFIRFGVNNNIVDYPIHLKIDTGMHRLGFLINELDMLCKQIKDNPSMRVQSVFSHLAASESSRHDEFTLEQISLFELAARQIESEIGYTFIKHLCNTSAISRWPQAQYNMVRLGIGLYGIDSATPITNNSLLPVASLKTSIAQVKSVSAGETISYGRSGSLTKDGKIATVRIGYADGYLRAFGNGVGRMMVKGKLAPTVGNITMDMCMLDISDIDAAEGDEVVVFNEDYRIELLAKQIGTIPYEILTNVSQRVKRIYFYE